MSTLNCPNCAAELEKRLQYTKFMVCPYCQSRLFLEDDAVRHAGEMSAMTEVPSILKLGGDFTYRGWNFIPVGRVRYDYGRGFWDEWWVMDNEGKGKWISVDEGDIAIEESVEFEDEVPSFDGLSIGDAVKLGGKDFIVTEKNACVSKGAEGELPFEIIQDESYNFIDLSGAGKRIVTLEYFKDGVDCYEGVWVDPFDVKANS